MRKFLLTVIFMLGCLAASSQTPKAVIKSVLSGEGYQKANEKYERALEKNAADSPSMIVARAVLWDSWAKWCDYFKDYKDDKYFSTRYTIDAYYLLCDSKGIIESDEGVDKMLKGLKTSYQDIFSGIENTSAEYVFEINSESRYDEYIRYARAHSHPQLDTLLILREERAYKDACEAASEKAFRRYLDKYKDAPQEHIAQVDILLRDLLFNQAYTSSDMSLIKQFIQTYPLYHRTEELYPILRRLQWPSYTERDALLYMAWGAVRSLRYDTFTVEFDRNGFEIEQDAEDDLADDFELDLSQETTAVPAPETGARVPDFRVTERDIWGNWTARIDENEVISRREIEYYL